MGVQGDFGSRLLEDGTSDGRAGERAQIAARARMLLGRLEELAESQIIPRLARADAAPPPRVEAPGCSLVLEEDVTRLCHMVMSADADAERKAEALVDAMRHRGLPAERLFFELLGPVARLLGRYWEEDRCDFTQVTVGVWRLERIMRGLAPAFRGERDVRLRGRAILLMPTPGEQHTFGLHLVAECFRRAGWQVDEELPPNPAAAGACAGRRAYDVAGFTLGSDRGVDALARAISLVRRASLNRDICIIVGGALFEAQPGLVTRVGADSLARDGARAVEHAEMLMGSVA